MNDTDRGGDQRGLPREVGLICGSLVRITGDFDLAEDLVQDAVVVALQRWPIDGVPERPAAWLLQTARRRAIDRLRRDCDVPEQAPVADGRLGAARAFRIPTIVSASSSSAATRRSRATRRWR